MGACKVAYLLPLWSKGVKQAHVKICKRFLFWRVSRCMGMLTDSELSRCEARLGLVSLFMPTQPDGDYKLDLRDFEERQIVTLLLG